MAFSLGGAFKGLGGLFGGAGGSGGEQLRQGRSLFDFMGRDAMDRVGRGMSGFGAARSIADGDYGAALNLFAEMEKRKREEEERRRAGIDAPRTQGFGRQGFGEGIY